MTSTRAPSDLLIRHAPDFARPDDLDHVLARVKDISRPRPSSPKGARRLALAVGTAATAAVLAVVLPASLTSTGSSAAALDRLAATAASRPATVIPKGSFLHLTTIENPDGSLAQAPAEMQGEPGTYPRTLESWTDSDGVIWRHDHTAAGQQQWYRFEPTRTLGSAPGDTPQELAALPTDDQALLHHLRPIVQGSSSTDEAVFVYLADALRTGYAPPETQRAMIAAMARLPHVETERTRAHSGQPCLAVRYTERPRVVQSVCFDEATATLLEEQDLQDGDVVFTSVVTNREVVPTLPADVKRNAAAG